MDVIQSNDARSTPLIGTSGPAPLPGIAQSTHVCIPTLPRIDWTELFVVCCKVCYADSKLRLGRQKQNVLVPVANSAHPDLLSGIWTGGKLVPLCEQAVAFAEETKCRLAVLFCVMLADRLENRGIHFRDLERCFAVKHLTEVFTKRERVLATTPKPNLPFKKHATEPSLNNVRVFWSSINPKNADLLGIVQLEFRVLELQGRIKRVLRPLLEVGVVK